MIAITDYGSGNLASVRNALEHLGQKCVITSDPGVVAAADGVICPGQGRAGVAMRNLRQTGLDKLIPELRQPFLGICVGMQLLGKYSEEDGQECLGVLDGTSRKFPSNLNLNTPHLGWNRVEFVPDSELMQGIKPGAYFYFVHSYYLDAKVDAEKTDVMAVTNYGVEFLSVVNSGRFYSVQFHPEKSGENGLQLLKNFCRICS